LNNLTLKDIL